MPFIEPQAGDVHVDSILSAVSVAFRQEEEAFVAARVFPEVSVSKRSDLYFTIPRGAWNRRMMKKRDAAAPSAQATYQVATDNYLADVNALHIDIDDQTRSNQDDPLNLNTQATQFLTTQALIDREVDWTDNYFTAGDPGDTWTFDTDGAATGSLPAVFDPQDAANNQLLFWDDPTSTPIEDVRQGKRFVQSITGFRPNIFTTGRKVYDTLLDHPDIVGRLDRGQTTGAARVMRANLAELFEVEEVVVMDSIQNTGVEGQADVHDFIGGLNAMLTYRPRNAGLMIPSAGYTFTWNGFLGASDGGIRMKQFRVEENAADRVEIESAFDHKLVAADLGYFFGGIVQ